MHSCFSRSAYFALWYVFVFWTDVDVRTNVLTLRVKIMTIHLAVAWWVKKGEFENMNKIVYILVLLVMSIVVLLEIQKAQDRGHE